MELISQQIFKKDSDTVGDLGLNCKNLNEHWMAEDTIFWIISLTYIDQPDFYSPNLITLM